MKNRYRSCVCKKRYTDEAKAQRACAHLNSCLAKNGAKRKEAYKCLHCPGWHVGAALPTSGEIGRRQKANRRKAVKRVDS